MPRPVTALKGAEPTWTRTNEPAVGGVPSFNVMRHSAGTEVKKGDAVLIDDPAQILGERHSGSCKYDVAAGA